MSIQAHKPEFFKEIDNFFSSKIKEHGCTPSGVDFNGEEAQFLRFSQLAQVWEGDTEFSLNDLGCGYGALMPFLSARSESIIDFCGYDINASMIEAAQSQQFDEFKGQYQFQRLDDASQMRDADYVVASGIFNLKFECAEEDWVSYILETLEAMNARSKKGFSFNCLTKYSDADKMRPDLYYSDPCYLFDLCKKKYSRNVALLHDYDLYDFTIVVRK